MSQPRTLSRCSDTRIKKENTSFPFPTPAATQVEPYLVGRGAGNGNGVHFLSIVFTVTQQKIKLETVQWKKPRKGNVVKD